MSVSEQKGTPGDEQIVLLSRGLDRVRAGHAFGGRLALSYYTAPETVDAFEIWVFEPERRIGRVLRALAALGVDVDGDSARAQLREHGRCGLEWESEPIDLYCAYDPWHEACARRVRRVPFGEDEIPILSAEDLAVVLTLAGLADAASVLPPAELEQLLFARTGDLDLPYIRGWLARMLEPDDPRRQGFEAVACRMLGDPYLFYGTTLRCVIESADGRAVIRQVLALAGEVELPDSGTPAFETLARGVSEGPALVQKAAVRDSTALLSGLQAGTYTVVAIGYELADPRNRVMYARSLRLAEGVEEARVDFSC